MTILRIRVIEALESAHLSVPRLAALLGATETHVHHIVSDLRSAGAVQLSLTVPCGSGGAGRPQKFWRLAA
jgi:predicted ArsR family transcriptional regulator